MNDIKFDLIYNNKPVIIIQFLYNRTYEEFFNQRMDTFHTLRWLLDMTGIPGFPARAVWVKGERAHKSMGTSGDAPAEWHDVKGTPFEWKGDTSSDEICAHFYGMAVSSRPPQGPEVQQCKDFFAQVAGHLVDHGWRLIDFDGKPTRWGSWDPEYFNKAGEGNAARGLNGLEILSFIKAAEAITGDPKFAKGYQELVKLGYPEYTLRQKAVFPPQDVLQFLDELAFFCYPNLIKFETDPRLPSPYRRSLSEAGRWSGSSTSRGSISCMAR